MSSASKCKIRIAKSKAGVGVGCHLNVEAANAIDAVTHRETVTATSNHGWRWIGCHVTHSLLPERVRPNAFRVCHWRSP